MKARRKDHHLDPLFVPICTVCNFIELFSILQGHGAVILAVKDEEGGGQEFDTRNRQETSIQFKNYTLGLLFFLRVKALPKHEVCPKCRNSLSFQPRNDNFM